MNGFQHLPEYQSAATAYRLERTVVRRSPRHGSGRREGLRGLLAALTRRPVRAAAAGR